jgi:predicted transposase/invertase (TIGR01784 family)
LIPLIPTSDQPRDEKDHLIELVETVMLYKLPHLARTELEKMLLVESYRQTRVCQEGLEEGIEKGKEAAAEEFARRPRSRKFAMSEIAELTGLSPSQIKKLKPAGGTKKRRKAPGPRSAQRTCGKAGSFRLS